jgi:arylsulfatase A-like enzyme
MTSIFTGLYPEQYDFFENRFPDESIPLVSAILKTCGYRVQILSNNHYMSPETGFGRGADDFYFIYLGKWPGAISKSVMIRRGMRLLRQMLHRRTAYKIMSEMLNDQAGLLIRRAASLPGPFFLYIHHDAHHPYLSERKYLKKFLGAEFSEEEVRLVERVQSTGNMYWFSRESISPGQRQRYYDILRAMHDASIYKNDLLLKALFEDLKAGGLYDNTMIVITADHGEFLGEKDLVSHGLYPFEQSVRVPLIIKYPKSMNLSGRSGRLTSTIDLAPTLVELAGSDLSDHIPQRQGLSLLGDDQHEFVVAQRENFEKGLDFWNERYPDHSFEPYDLGRLYCFKSEGRKFVWSSKGKHALFNLEADPHEVHNLIDEDENRSLTYLNRAEEWMSHVPRIESAGIGEFDEKIKQHLRGLGYLE